jgi:hypothetical protein
MLILNIILATLAQQCVVVHAQNEVHNAHDTATGTPVNDRVDTLRQTNFATLDDVHANDNHQLPLINIVGPPAIEINMASVRKQILFLATIVFSLNFRAPKLDTNYGCRR